MATETGAYNLIRSRSRDERVAQAANAGRTPSISYGRGGATLRGFRSRPGAPQAANDTMYNLTGLEKGADGYTSKAAWDLAFRPMSEGGESGFGSFGAWQPDSNPDSATTDIPELFNYELSNRFAGNTFNAPLSYTESNPGSATYVPPVSPQSREWSPAPFMPRSPSDKFYLSGDGGFFETPLQDGWKTTPMAEVAAIGQKYAPKPNYLGSVINNAQDFFRRRRA